MSLEPFNPKKVEQYQKAIILRDYMKAWDALSADVDISTPINGQHPLEVLLYTTYSPKNKITVDEFNKQGSDVVQLLLDRGVKLVEKEKYANGSCDYLVDRLLASHRIEDLSEIVLHAIGQSCETHGFPYEMNVDSFIGNYLFWRGMEDRDLKGQVTEAVNVMEALHEVVRKRLMVPSTELEKEIVGRYSNMLDYWIHPFEYPSLEEIYTDMSPENAENKKNDKFDQMVKILPKKTPEQVLKEMDALVGMEDVKREARALVFRTHFDAARSLAKLPVVPQAMHTVFEGNPGTGKTTVARLRAELLYSLGLGGNRYIEISRENMVGQFIGQTEKNMLDLFNSADAVFIDEAYNLVADKDDNKDYGKRVIDALITTLENRRDTLAVFFAGYPNEMRKFISSNPGLQSRITHYQHLPDYTPEQLGQIMDRMLEKAGLRVAADARDYAIEQLARAKEAMGATDFGNARIVRTLVEQLPNKMAERLFSQAAAEMTSSLMVVPSSDALSTVTRADIEALNLTEKLGVTRERKVNYTPVGFKPSWMAKA